MKKSASDNYFRKKRIHRILCFYHRLQANIEIKVPRKMGELLHEKPHLKKGPYFNFVGSKVAMISRDKEPVGQLKELIQ